jgi:hypothetical protein
MMTAKSYVSIDGMRKKPSGIRNKGSNVIKLEVIKQEENNSYDELSKLCGEAIF